MTGFVRFVAVLAAISVPLAGATRADDAEIKKAVKGLVEKMQAATVKGDYGAVIDLTHPKVVEELGGREKAIGGAKAVMEMLKDKGLAIKSLKAEEPQAPVRGEKNLYVFVPTKMEMTTPKGTIVGTSYLLGVSSDDGKTWRFVDGAAGPDETRKMFPDIPEKLKLPKPEYKTVKD